MTIDEFIEEVADVSDQFQWILVPDEGGHAERRGLPRFRLRATAMSGPAKHMALVPLAAVCYARTQTLKHKSWMDAADTLGLTLDDARLLMAAGNDSTWTGEPGRRRPDAALMALRDRLVGAVGLSVPESAETSWEW